VQEGQGAEATKIEFPQWIPGNEENGKKTKKDVEKRVVSAFSTSLFLWSFLE
jgi:hypothetical protein